jgi:hypothetical protein
LLRGRRGENLSRELLASCFWCRLSIQPKQSACSIASWIRMLGTPLFLYWMTSQASG